MEEKGIAWHGGSGKKLADHIVTYRTESDMKP